MACSTRLCFSSTIPSPVSCSSGSSRFLAIQQVSSAPSLFRWTIQYKQWRHTLHRRSHLLAFASADAPQGKRNSGENVVMVDPLEAKRLAAKQMQEIRAKEKLKVTGRGENPPPEFHSLALERPIKWVKKFYSILILWLHCGFKGSTPGHANSKITMR